jgi:hypothetical protein
MSGVSNLYYVEVDPLPILVQPDADLAYVDPDLEFCPVPVDTDTFYVAAGKFQ